MYSDCLVERSFDVVATKSHLEPILAIVGLGEIWANLIDARVNQKEMMMINIDPQERGRIANVISCHYPKLLNAMSIDLLFLFLACKITKSDYFDLQALSVHQDQLPGFLELGNR
jgi:hypothetical protein